MLRRFLLKEGNRRNFLHKKFFQAFILLRWPQLSWTQICRNLSDMSKESKKGTLEKQGVLKANERWSARRKREVVLRLLRGEPLDTVSRVETYRLEQWREKAVLGIDEA